MSLTVTDRGLSPVVGVASLVAVTVVASAAVGAAVLPLAPPEPVPSAAIDVTATADGRVTLHHRGGAALDVAALTVQIRVDGEPLAHQPPVPFVGAQGYRGAPSGPFNAASDGEWTAGERASFRLAGTNAPALTSGARLTVDLHVENGRVARAETTVRD